MGSKESLHISKQLGEGGTLHDSERVIAGGVSKPSSCLSVLSNVSSLAESVSHRSAYLCYQQCTMGCSAGERTPVMALWAPNVLGSSILLPCADSRCVRVYSHVSFVPAWIVAQPTVLLKSRARPEAVARYILMLLGVVPGVVRAQRVRSGWRYPARGMEDKRIGRARAPCVGWR